jgi:peptide deformylase
MIENKSQLYNICEDVIETEDVTHIIKDLKATIYNNTDRYPVGLAANQIGYNKRIIVLNTPSFKHAMINPVIVKKSKQMTTQNEGCLSFPKDFIIPVTRHKQVTVEWINEQGKKVNQKFRNLDSRVIQHEIDHLNGITLEEYV